VWSGDRDASAERLVHAYAAFGQLSREYGDAFADDFRRRR
jgi:hypothetical protein